MSSVSAPACKRGFSLIELSIVIVIVGLLAGGVLMGQSLIRNSQLQAVLKEYQNYKDAVLAFRDQYDALPGDMFDAASYWATASNGNGDARIVAASAVSTAGEYAQFWSQLVLAKQIQGNYTGTSTATGAGHVQVGTNAPPSKLDDAGWSILWVGTQSAATNYFDGSFGNQFTYGATTGTAENAGPVLKPEELWNLDKKIDDGLAGSGSVLTRKSSVLANCATTDAVGSPYALTTSGRTCMGYFVPGF